MSSGLLAQLNDAQSQAVTHGEGPLLIVAGAGTGKTTVITERLGQLILSGRCKADQALCLTFTDKAATEMSERADRLMPYGYTDLWIYTFHAFAERLIRDYGLEIGLPDNFQLLSATGQWLLVRQNLERFNLDYYRPLGNPTKFIHALLRHFSRAKDENISPADYLAYVEELKLNTDSVDLVGLNLDEEMLARLSPAEIKNIQGAEILKQSEVAEAYHVYQQLLLENQALDFGDLISYSLRLLTERPNVLAKLRAQFKYILVDEFQDTNWAQYQLLKLLAAPRHNLTVVGDDDQCLPADTLISTDKGLKKIADINIGDSVVSAVGRGYVSYSRVSRVFKNKKPVKFITFRTARGHELTVTDNHKMFCLTPAIDDKKYYYVYLMERLGLGWRIGVTNDLAQRLRLERSADRILGVKTCQSETGARFFETLYSLKYNIPTVCFCARRGVAIKDEWLLKLYAMIDTRANAQKMAHDLNFDLNAHHYSLSAVNRGAKVRVKINLEMCHRSYRSKNAKAGELSRPKVSHLLSLQTSDAAMIKNIRQAGFDLKPAKSGKRLRIVSSDILALGRIAEKLQSATGGIIEVSAKLGRRNVQTLQSLVIPAKNVLIGQYLPVKIAGGIVYDRVLEKKEEVKRVATVYDLEVEDSHNFIANGIVVHNSIYKFRGASISNILKFKGDFPTAREIFLNQNYRSCQNILDLSYNFIQANNPYRLEIKLAEKSGQKLSKKLISQTPGAGEIVHLHGDTLNDETRQVVEKILALKAADPDFNWSDVAILVRANSTAADFCYALEQAGIPYDFLASRGLYSKAVVLDILAYLKLLDDYHESVAAWRVLSLPPLGLTHQDIVNLNYWANRKSWSLFEAMKNSAALPNISSEAREKISRLISQIDRHSALVRADRHSSEIIQSFLADSGYLKYLTAVDSAAKSEQLGYLNQFYQKVQAFEKETTDKSLKNFLALMDLELESGEEGSLAVNWEESGPDTVKVMTVHAAKGLEFPFVFVVGLVDKRFPTIERSEPIELPTALVKEILPEGDIHLQEERRLFYVATTRAKRGLYLTSASDYGGARAKKLSRFLTELSEQGLALAEQASAQKESLTAALEPSPEIARAKPVLSLPPKFSFTQLKAFENCPYQYRFAHLLKIPRRGKGQFSYGKSMHDALQKFFSELKRRQGPAAIDLFGATQKAPPPTVEELLKFYELSFIDDWYENRDQRDQYFEQGKKCLREFYARHQDAWPQVEHLEYAFNLKIKSAENIYTVFGRIDRVDRTGEGVRIIDYKTGTGKDKLAFEDKEQLLLYQLAAQEVFGATVQELNFYYLDDNRAMSFLGQPADLDKLKNKIVSTIEEIKKGDFPPRPSRLCRYCDFYTICEYREG